MGNLNRRVGTPWSTDVGFFPIVASVCQPYFIAERISPLNKIERTLHDIPAI
jgi:hypothetical protein